MSKDLQVQKEQTQELTQSDKRPSVTALVDIYENSDEVLLYADLPGVAPDTLSIHVDKGQLTLEGYRKLNNQSTAVAQEYLNECDFRRRFQLPSGIDSNKIHADLKNGVLQLHLPKADALKPRQIAIKAG